MTEAEAAAQQHTLTLSAAQLCTLRNVAAVTLAATEVTQQGHARSTRASKVGKGRTTIYAGNRDEIAAATGLRLRCQIERAIAKLQSVPTHSPEPAMAMAA
jgi:hypothetical protein